MAVTIEFMQGDFWKVTSEREEIATILRMIAKRVEDFPDDIDGDIIDRFGERIGSWSIT